MQQEILFTELKTILDQDPSGILRPETVVEVAQDVNSPLHRYFEWDNAQAAHEYRIAQARWLIKSVNIYIEPLDIRVRAFASLDIDRNINGGYRSMTSVMADGNLRDNLLSTAMRELKALESRFQHFNELARIWNEIDKATIRVSKRKPKVSA